MGDANPAPGRCAGHEEVLSDEVAHKAQSPGEAQPPSRRDSSGISGTNVHGRRPVSDSKE